MPDSFSTPIDERSIAFYLKTLASAAPAPGGGSAAGIGAALAAALAEMVCNLTLSRALPPEIERELRRARDSATDLRARFVAVAEEDEIAYRGYATAAALPKESEAEKRERRITMQAALREAAAVPLRLGEGCLALLEALDPIVRHGNRHVLSDAIIAIRLVEAALAAAALNVSANAQLMKNPADAEHYRQRIAAIENASRAAVATLLDLSAR